MDVESLQNSSRRRGSCLDVFLVMSIIFLFVAVAAVAVGGMMVVVDLRSKLESAPQSSRTEKLVMATVTPSPSYKRQNFVYLQARSSELKTSTMQWAPVAYGTGDSVGSKFLFDKEQNSLKINQEGTYFMYIDLNFTCTYHCTSGLLSVHVGDKFTCEVKLPAVADSTPVSKKCWIVKHLNEQKLFTQMTVSVGELQYWKLELNTSGFGMFLVD